MNVIDFDWYRMHRLWDEYKQACIEYEFRPCEDTMHDRSLAFLKWHEIYKKYDTGNRKHDIHQG